jgi:hypothetical protein
MGKIRLFTVTAVLSVTAGFSLVASGGAHAAVGAARVPAAGNQPAASPDTSIWSKPWGLKGPLARGNCPGTDDLLRPGAEYRVEDPGIHIRVSPGGAAKWAISQGSSFTSNWNLGSVGGYRCVARAGGSTWVLGTASYGHYGWVNAKYLSSARYISPG